MFESKTFLSPLIPAKAGIQQEKMSGEARLIILTGPRLSSGRTEEESAMQVYRPTL
jgi:hypothetical protein